MFFFKSKKQKQILGVKKTIFAWGEACLANVDYQKLKKARPIIGSVSFFTGAIDLMSKSISLTDIEFHQLATEIIVSLGFQEDYVHNIIGNFHLQPKGFALEANLAGASNFRNFFNKNLTAPLEFGDLVSNWHKVELKEEELYLQGID